MKRLGLSWVIAAGIIGAAVKPLVKAEEKKAPAVNVAPAAPAATPEMADDIDYSRENAEAENSPYRRLVKAAASECIAKYGKKIAGNLKGVKAICAEYYDASAEDEHTTEGVSLREAMDDFYVAALAQLSREEKIAKAIYKKEEARIAAKWSRK
jgi:hypothetical protein